MVGSPGLEGYMFARGRKKKSDPSAHIRNHSAEDRAHDYLHPSIAFWLQTVSSRCGPRWRATRFSTMQLGPPRATSVTFVYPWAPGRDPVAELPRHWYATVCWGDGGKGEVWFCQHTRGCNHECFAAVSGPSFDPIDGFGAAQNAEEGQALADISRPTYGSGHMELTEGTWSRN